MVVLLHMERPSKPIRNVRQIIYESREDIPLLLGTSRSLIGSVSAQDVDVRGGEALPEDDEDDPLALEEETGLADTGQAEEVAAEPLVMPPALAAVEHTEEEIHAALVIQQAFKRGQKRVERRNAEMAKSNLAASCASFFAICLKEAEGIDWPDRAYRFRYLGPLPHLLLCLDVVLSTAQKQKKQIKKDLREAKHEKLEALDKQLTELTCV